MATKRKMDMSLDEIIETKRNEGLKLSQNTSSRSNFAHPNMDDFIQFEFLMVKTSSKLSFSRK